LEITTLLDLAVYQPPSATTLVVLCASALMVYAGLGKRRLSWRRRVPRKARVRRADRRER